MTAHSDIRFFLRFEPDIPKLTHQNGIKVGKNGMVYKSQELKNLEAKYIAYLRKRAPKEPWSCPVQLTTEWHFNSKKKLEHWKWHTQKPDTDNLVKTLKDCMTKAGFFTDDKIVCEEKIAKIDKSADDPHGICIWIHEMEQQ